LSVNKASALVVFGSGNAFALGEIAERHKVPMIALATAVNVTDGKNYTFRHLLDSERESMRVVKEVDKRGYKNVAIVTTLQDGMLALRDAFRAKSKVSVVLDQEVLPDEINFRSIVTQIKQKKPDAVYLVLLPPHLSYFVRQLKEQGYTGALFSAHQAEDRAEFKAAGSYLKGIWYVNIDDSKAQGFYQRYREAYGIEPTNTAVNGYDIAKLLIRAAQSGNVYEYLNSVKNFDGIVGNYGVTNRRDFDLPVAVKMITEKGFEFVK
jgi:branched-chain amino acid transport system substrate-binding protein